MLKYLFTVTLVKPEHPAKAFAPTLVIVDGIVTLVKPEQPEKALATMVVMVEANVTLAKLERAPHTGTSPA